MSQSMLLSEIVFWLKKLILRHVWSILPVLMSFGVEINSLAKMQIGNANNNIEFWKIQSKILYLELQNAKKIK